LAARRRKNPGAAEPQPKMNCHKRSQRSQRKNSISSYLCVLYVPLWQKSSWNCMIPRYCTAKEQPAENFNHPDGIGRFHGRRNSWTKWTSQRHGAGTGKRKTFLPADGGMLLRQGYGGQGFTQMRQTSLNRCPYRKPNQPRNTPNTRTPKASGERSGFFAFFASFAVQGIFVTVQAGSGRDASPRRPGVAVLPWTPRRGVPT